LGVSSPTCSLFSSPPKLGVGMSEESYFGEEGEAGESIEMILKLFDRSA
jgi:hypothetical protein